jgi:hypothetical protein
VLIVALIVAIWWRGGISPAQIPFRRRRISIAPAFSALSVMFWCLSAWKPSPIWPRNLNRSAISPR